MAMMSPAVVLDVGSASVKCGYAGEAVPRSVFPSLSDDTLDSYVSKQRRPLCLEATPAEMVRSDFTRSAHPVHRGKVVDWDGLERLLDFTIEKEMEFSTAQDMYPVLMTEAPLQSRDDRDRLAELIFEKYRAPGLQFSNTSVVSLYATGRTRGIVAECGAGVTFATPIFEGFALTHAVLRMDLGGQDITAFMRKQLDNNGYHMDFDSVRRFKETLACVPTSLFSALGTGAEEATDDGDFELPDGTVVQFSREHRQLGSDVMFNPVLIGEDIAESAPAEGKGIAHMVKQSIGMCDTEIRADLYQNIVMAGGSTMMPGFCDRMFQELEPIAEASGAIRVIPHSQMPERGYRQQRHFAPWIGASLLASMETFADLQVTKQDWDDNGPTAVRRKCL